MMDRRAAWRECSADGRLPWYPLTHERFVRRADEEGWQRVMEAVAGACAAWIAMPRP
jgi:hypothetical protein